MPRPRLRPTDEQRRLVKSLAAVGLTQAQIAGMIGIRSPKTLRRHFRAELEQGDLEGYAKVQQTHFRMATSGKCWPATKAWQDAYHRRHLQSPDQGGPVSPPEKRKVTRIVWRTAEQLKENLPPEEDKNPTAFTASDSQSSKEAEKPEVEPPDKPPDSPSD